MYWFIILLGVMKYMFGWYVLCITSPGTSPTHTVINTRNIKIILWPLHYDILCIFKISKYYNQKNYITSYIIHCIVLFIVIIEYI